MDRNAALLSNVPPETLSKLESLLQTEPEGFPEFPQDAKEEDTMLLTPIVSILGEIRKSSQGTRLAVEWRHLHPTTGEKITLEDEDYVRGLVPEVFATYLLKRRKPVLEAEAEWNTIPAEPEISDNEQAEDTVNLGVSSDMLVEEDSSYADSEESSYSPSEVSHSNRDKVRRRSSGVSGKNKGCLENCVHCGKSKHETPMMRRGPSGKTELCNACGLRFAKYGKL